MRIFRNRPHYDFVSLRRITFAISGILLLISLGSMMVRGLNYGIDFSGGTLIQLRFPEAAPIKEVRKTLTALDYGDLVIQEFGSPEEIMVRVEKQPKDSDEQAKMSKTIVDALNPLAGDKGVEMRRVEFVGPQVGSELRTQGIMAVIYSMIAILAYVAWRFELRFAYGAVLALMHDITITVGFFSIMQKEFTLVVVAALLTVIGYSLNDTIVVYDRIREEMKRLRKHPMTTIINEAVNRTLSRTLVTSLTTILVLCALLLFGGEVIHDFALTLFLGVLIGTYSSIFVASPVVLLLDRSGGKPATPAKKESKEMQGEPSSG
ncbi:MAG: protein translocase subunit SecF [Magnetococcales bacterium]|nr:protein translocase subunit SecF [Magnetococcales bacterium]